MTFRYITKEEMCNNIFSYKDFPVVFGFSSKFYLDKTGYYGLFIENKLIGICHIKFKKDYCRLKAIEIKKNYQNQGYGSYILQEIEKIAKQNNYKQIRLCPRDYRVYNFYTNNDYEFIHEHLILKNF